MSSKLFAFNISKETELSGEQWVGNQTIRGVSGYPVCEMPSLCSGGQDYGDAACWEYEPTVQCCVSGGSGYYICDNAY